MFSVTFIFIALSGYGTMQQRIINSAHLTNYLQDAFKSIYYIDASTLSSVRCDGNPNYCKAGSTTSMGCEDLEEWTGVSVAELLKRDLRDYEGNPGEGLDDLFGPAPAPGKLAAKCAFKEIFKPVSDAGYSYFVEFRRIRGSSIQLVPQTSQNITNLQGISDCSQNVHPSKTVINAPFRVFKCTVNILDKKECSAENYTMSACIWPIQKLP